MARINIKPKAAAIWNKQTEKLKQKLAELTGADLYFEQSKLDEMIVRVRGGIENPRMEYVKHYTKEKPYRW